MGVNLVPIVPIDRTFKIISKAFSKQNHSDEHNFEDGCIKQEGFHRLLSFEFMCHNIGDTDLVAGSPKSRPDIFTKSGGHAHWHLVDLNKYTIRKKETNEILRSEKQSFCLLDMIPLSFPPEQWPSLRRRFTKCENENDIQGISAGWADIYRRGVPCQFIVLENPDGSVNASDGKYELEVTTNATRIFEEDEYKDNTIYIDFEISDKVNLNNVTLRNPMLTNI